jgi:hypothetical protein
MTATSWCSALQSRKTRTLLPSALVGSSCLRSSHNPEKQAVRPEGRPDCQTSKGQHFHRTAVVFVPPPLMLLVSLVALLLLHHRLDGGLTLCQVRRMLLACHLQFGRGLTLARNDDLDCSLIVGDNIIIAAQQP